MPWCVDSLGEFYNCNESTTVYFDCTSGDTHLLSEFAAHLLQAIAQQPMTIDQLIEKVSSDVEPNDRSELGSAIAEILNELATLDVITRV
jgi:PqqD family protein of HPr-rel-A system